MPIPCWFMRNKYIYCDVINNGKKLKFDVSFLIKKFDKILFLNATVQFANYS